MANYDPNSGQTYGEWLRQQNPNRQERYSQEEARAAAAQYLGRAGSEAEVRDWQTLATQTGGFNFMRNSPEAAQNHFNTSLNNPEHRGVMSSAGIAKGEYFTFDPSISARHDKRAYEVRDADGNLLKDEAGNIIYVKGDKRASGSTQNLVKYVVHPVGNYALSQIPYGVGGLAKPLTNYLDSRILNTEYKWKWGNAVGEMGDFYAPETMTLIRGTRNTGPKKDQRDWGDVMKDYGIQVGTRAISSYLNTKLDTSGIGNAAARTGAQAAVAAGSSYAVNRVAGRSNEEALSAAAQSGTSAAVAAGLQQSTQGRMRAQVAAGSSPWWNLVPDAQMYQSLYMQGSQWWENRTRDREVAALAGQRLAAMDDATLAAGTGSLGRIDYAGQRVAVANDVAEAGLSTSVAESPSVTVTPAPGAPVSTGTSVGVTPAQPARIAFRDQAINSTRLRQALPNFIETWLPHGTGTMTPAAPSKLADIDAKVQAMQVKEGQQLIYDTKTGTPSVMSDRSEHVLKPNELRYVPGSTIGADGQQSSLTWVRSNQKKEEGSFWTNPAMITAYTSLAGLGYSEYRARKADRKADRIRREDKAEVQRLQQEQQAMADAYNEEYLAALESSGSHNISSVNVWA